MEKKKKVTCYVQLIFYSRKKRAEYLLSSKSLVTSPRCDPLPGYFSKSHEFKFHLQVISPILVFSFVSRFIYSTAY